MPTDYFQRVHRETPTRFWINNPTGDECRLALTAGAICCTTNPTYGARLLQQEPEVMSATIAQALAACPRDDDAADRAAELATARLIEAFLPRYEQSRGCEGFVTIQDDPSKEEDADRIVTMALRFRRLGPNFMAKIPVTTAGLTAIEHLVAEDIPLCATEVFALDQAIAVCESYQRASEKSGKTPPFFVTHITGIFDEYLAQQVQKQGIDIAPETLAWAGCTVGRQEYRLQRERGYPGTLLGGGARGIRHFTAFVGGDFHITINWSTAQELLDSDPHVVSQIEVETPAAIHAELYQKLEDYRLAVEIGALPVEAFETYGPVELFRNRFIAGYEQLKAEIARQRSV